MHLVLTTPPCLRRDQLHLILMPLKILQRNCKKFLKLKLPGTYYATMLETRPVASDFNATQNNYKESARNSLNYPTSQPLTSER